MPGAIGAPSRPIPAPNLDVLSLASTQSCEVPNLGRSPCAASCLDQVVHVEPSGLEVLAQLAQGVGLNLPRPLFADAKLFGDFLKRRRAFVVLVQSGGHGLPGQQQRAPPRLRAWTRDSPGEAHEHGHVPLGHLGAEDAQSRVRRLPWRWVWHAPQLSNQGVYCLIQRRALVLGGRMNSAGMYCMGIDAV